MINGKHGQGTHSTKMGVDKSAKNTPNAPKLNSPSPIVWYFDEKRLHWASVVRERKQWGKKNYEVALENFFHFFYFTRYSRIFILAINMCLQNVF